MLAEIPMNGENAPKKTEDVGAQGEQAEETVDLERDRIKSLIELMEQEEQSSEWRQIRDTDSDEEKIPEFDLNVKLKRPGKGIPERKAKKEESAEPVMDTFDIEKALAMADDTASNPIGQNIQENAATIPVNVQEPRTDVKNQEPEMDLDDLYRALEGLDDDSGSGFFFGGSSNPFQTSSEFATGLDAPPKEQPKKEEIKEPDFASEADSDIASELEKADFADLAQLFDSDPMMNFDIALDNEVKFDFIAGQIGELEVTSASAPVSSIYSDTSHSPPVKQEDEIPPEILFSVDESLIEIDDTGKPIEDLEAEIEGMFQFLQDFSDEKEMTAAPEDISMKPEYVERSVIPASAEQSMMPGLETEFQVDSNLGIDSDYNSGSDESSYTGFSQTELSARREAESTTAYGEINEQEDLQIFANGVSAIADDDEEVEAIDDYETTYRVKIEKYLQNGKRLTIREFLNDNILSDGIAKVLDSNLYLNKAASIKLYSRAEVFIVNDDVRNAVSLLESICLYSLDAAYSTRALARLKTLVSPAEKDNVELLVREMINKEMRLMNIVERI